jgi:predicted RNase H-like HicB family nuclease
MAEKEFDAVAMVRKIRDAIYEETKDLSAAERTAYLKRKSDEFRASEAERLARHERDGAQTTIQYAVVIQRSETGFGAYVPDLPGCVAVGDTEGEVRDLIREAIESHLASLRENGDEVPSPATRVEYMAVPHSA